ncbi:MAG TPA: squalene synthase HpnC, partial [Planctomycetaceae bacterium]|nr:squalene synthase HpnC [Planctomycetaceae bacterium]
YLPREDRERFGYRDEDLHARRATPQFRRLMRFEVDRAQRFLEDGLALVARLPGRLQVDIEMFARGGLRILERIRANQYDVWAERPVLTRADRIGLLAGGLFRWLGRAAGARMVSVR